MNEGLKKDLVDIKYFKGSALRGWGLALCAWGFVLRATTPQAGFMGSKFRVAGHDEKGSGVAKAMPDRHVLLSVDR